MKKPSATAAAQGDHHPASTSDTVFHLVTLPDHRVVIRSQPLPHRRGGSTSFSYVLNPIVAFLLVQCVNLDKENIERKHSNVALAVMKKIDVANIHALVFKFLLGEKFNLYSLSGESGFSLAASQMARQITEQLDFFSGCIEFPLLQSITDNLFYAALCGDERLVHVMIEKNPNYLLECGSATDFSGRTYTHFTPFQAALITGDIKMVEMMKPYFDRLPDGLAKMQEQARDISIMRDSDAKQLDIKKLKQCFEKRFGEVTLAINEASSEDLTAALNTENNDSALCKALDEFRQAFTALSLKEKIFNPGHFIKALENYNVEFDRMQSDPDKLNLFWRQFGFLQRFFPANYAQDFVYDLTKTLQKKKESLPSRQFNFKYQAMRHLFFYPLIDKSGVGYDWAVNDHGSRTFAPGCSTEVLLFAASFKGYVKQKNKNLEKLVAQPVKPITQPVEQVVASKETNSCCSCVMQ
jgi:hypothetical protein